MRTNSDYPYQSYVFACARAIRLCAFILTHTRARTLNHFTTFSSFLLWF
ncbi:AAEL017121-PA [Aedes aegypti]|uniref:AAEL017121-PA n=1 Tax=Aedes aegypti TaxID=7159 RepID=J9I088_AEDAE|nr:AAEL017121-PA [Aedes aegypti]